MIVGDNEIDGALFALRRDPSGGLMSLEPSCPPPDGVAVDDIEALAVDERVVALGSHGRSARCERRPSREHLAVVAWDPVAGALLLVILDRRNGRGRHRAAGRRGASAGAVRHAGPGGLGSSASGCSKLESRVSSALYATARHRGGRSVRPEPGDRVWPGCASRGSTGVRPCLATCSRPAAAPFRRGGVARCGGPRVRAATRAGSDLWFILGPGAPSFDRSQLWRARTADLVPGALLAGDVAVDGLLPESEGLVVISGLVTVAIDGDESSDETSACSRPSLQQVIRLRVRTDQS